MSEYSTPAHLFFRACGFRATGIHPRYFADPAHDAYEFVYSIREPAAW